MYIPLPSFSMAVMTSGSSRTMPFIFSFFSASWWIFFFRCAAVSGNQGPVGGHIQEPRSLKGAAFNEGGQIDEHLQVHAVEHVGELELLDAGLIVHNAHIGLPVELGQIHPVDFAADGHRSLFCGNPQGRELGAVFAAPTQSSWGQSGSGPAPLHMWRMTIQAESASRRSWNRNPSAAVFRAAHTALGVFVNKAQHQLGQLCLRKGRHFRALVLAENPFQQKSA